MLKIKEAHFLAIDFEYRQQGQELEPRVSELGLATWQVDSSIELVDYKQFNQGDALEDYWPQFSQLMTEKTVLVAHARGTEKKFLQKCYPHLNALLWVDTLVLSKTLYPQLASYELNAICQELQLMSKIQQSVEKAKIAKENAQWHSAGYDAIACLELWKYIVEQTQWADTSLAVIAAK